MYDDADLVARLRAGDGAAFREVVGRHHASMVRVARTFVPSDAVAEEVVQDTWLAVVRGIDGFEGRSSLRTWLFRILVNRARTRGVREARTVPDASLGSDGDDGPSVPADRFAGPPGRGGWAAPLPRWGEQPEEVVLSAETLAVVAETVRTLPESQRRVLVLRDVEGWASEEVRELLGLSEVNQRVLLHRARSRVRAAIGRHLEASR